ncbi:hypothetical protein RHGRI_004883 [Rhododendron griersonianum]|uniref:Uncharacterized protein n=1 Tax=Rhododendron griersonianum TaxID=479676 RepID=A0AAV6LB19_9ERIC|nr:hypothetical protein RHGRI_004883 [Rhododendron griersonianum]
MVVILQIKKFRDALAKHSSYCCSLGPLKGLEEKELLVLAANKETWTQFPQIQMLGDHKRRVFVWKKLQRPR